MKQFRNIATTFLSLSLLTSLSFSMNAQESAQKQDSLKPFPQAEEGMVRHVIELEKHTDESLYKVEIIPGKTMSVDCNHHRLMGQLSEEAVQGWGYTYYKFTSNGEAMSTMMACHQPKKMKFVTGDTKLVRYNSKLPIVIYAPKGFDIKYKIWEAGEELSAKIK